MKQLTLNTKNAKKIGVLAFFELLSGIFRKVDFSTFSKILQKLLKVKIFFADSDREWPN
jgi:hypothetical protein